MHRTLMICAVFSLMALQASARDFTLNIPTTHVEIVAHSAVCPPDIGVSHPIKVSGTFEQSSIFEKTCRDYKVDTYTLEQQKLSRNGGLSHKVSDEHLEQLDLYFGLINVRGYKRQCDTMITYIVNSYAHDSLVSSSSLMDNACFAKRRYIDDSQVDPVRYISPNALTHIYEDAPKTPDHPE